MDHYEALRVRPTASVAEIRRAYQKQARLHHPDLNPGDPVAVERFRDISRAFQVLSDPQRRAEYDRGETPAPAPRVPEVGFEGFDFSAQVRVDAVGVREIFEGVIGPSAGTEAASALGEELEQTTRLSFEESFRGTRRRIHLVRLSECAACRGRGETSLQPRPCPACQGLGQMRASRGRMIFTRPCRDCGATGTLGRQPCPRCRGEGRVMNSEWLEVHIPAGVSDGTRLRVPGAGNAGRRGGATGDLVLVVGVEPHHFFRREGTDLHCEVPVTITEAALGAHVEVPTLDGSVSIGIPAGTQTGQRFRLRKRGLPIMAAEGDKRRGDLYVQVRVWVPPVQDDESRRLLEEFARRNPGDPRRSSVPSRAAGRKG